MKFTIIALLPAFAAVACAVETELVHKTHKVEVPARPLAAREPQSSCSGSSSGGSSGGYSGGSSGGSYKRDLMGGNMWMDKREPHWTDMVRNLTLAPDGVVDVTEDGYAVSIAGDMETVLDEVKLSAAQIAQRKREQETTDPKLLFERQASCGLNSGGRCRSIRCYTQADCPKPQCYFCNMGSVMTCR